MINIKKYHVLTYAALLLMSIPAYSQTTDAPLMQSQINKPNGVAGLDEAGNVTSPVKTDESISTTSNLDIGTLSSKPRATFFQNYGDIASSPHTIHFGGLEPASDAYLNVIGMTMGRSDASGAILSVQDSGYSFYGNRNGAGLTDAIVEFTKTNNNAPRLKAGPEILNAIDKDGNPIGRTVTITKTGFYVSPAFSEDQMKTIRGSGRIRVYTNWKNGNLISSDTKKGLHGLDRPNVYYGYIDSDTLQTSKDKTQFVVFYDPFQNTPDYIGWRTEYNTAKQSYASSDNIAMEAPGQNSGDTIDNINDTNSTIPSYVWSYSTPSVFIGMSDKKFLHNDMAQFIPGDKDSTRKDSISRAMTGVEYDFLAMQDHDYQYKVEGIMVAGDGHGYKLTTDSQDMYLGGNINHHLVIGDPCESYGIESTGIMVPGECNTKTPNSGYVMGKFKGKSYYGDTIAISINNLTKENPDYGWGNNVPTIMATVNTESNETKASLDDNQNPYKATVGLAGIKWKQDADQGSISLCGGSFAKNCGLTVASDGSIKIGMQGILALDSSAKSYVQWYPTVDGDWKMGTSIANGGNLRGVNGYYGNSATIKGTIDADKINTNSLTVDGSIKIGMQGILALDSSAKNYVQWYPTVDGDWRMGTSIVNGGNLRGVNGYYGNSATIKGTIDADKINTNSLTVQNGMSVGGDLGIKAGKSVVFFTSKNEIGGYIYSDTTSNLIVMANSNGGGIGTANYNLANLPTPSSDHVMLWCSDCKVNGIVGAPVWWHKNISKWTDSQNNLLTNK